MGRRSDDEAAPPLPPWRATARMVHGLAAGLATIAAGVLLLLQLLWLQRGPPASEAEDAPPARLGPMTPSERAGE